jgi:hypothetical protein
MAILSSADMFYTAYEPKLQNRFIFYIDGIPAYLVKTADKPKYSAEEVVLDHINVKRKVKGKSDWNPITCTLYDPVTPSGAQAVMEWVRLHHESVTGRDGYSDFYKKDIRFNTLGPVWFSISLTGPPPATPKGPTKSKSDSKFLIAMIVLFYYKYQAIVGLA